MQVLILEREMKPQMDADKRRFSRSHANRVDHPTGEAREVRKSLIVSVHLRPSAVQFSSLTPQLAHALRCKPDLTQ
jgi:hypothetical protein